jgi:hypothetical protein
VRAHNLLGWGDYGYSTLSSGSATVRTVPHQMSAPTITSYSDTQIVVSWTALSSSVDMGGASIVTYELLWDNGSGSATPSISLSSSLTTTFTV